MSVGSRCRRRTSTSDASAAAAAAGRLPDRGGPKNKPSAAAPRAHTSTLPRGGHFTEVRPSAMRWPVMAVATLPRRLQCGLQATHSSRRSSFLSLSDCETKAASPVRAPGRHPCSAEKSSGASHFSTLLLRLTVCVLCTESYSVHNSVIRPRCGRVSGQSGQRAGRLRWPGLAPPPHVAFFLVFPPRRRRSAKVLVGG